MNAFQLPLPNPEDAELIELIQRARQGDPVAAAELLKVYRNYLRVLAQVQVGKSLRRKLDASDLVQETCLAACRDFQKFRGNTEAELVGWLRAILTNTGAKMVRHFKGTHRRDVTREESFGHDVDRSAITLSRLASAHSTPSVGVARREAAVVLADKLAELPEHYREALTLYHLQGYTLAEVASRIGRSPEATNSLVARALVKLRKLMKETR